MNLTPEEKLMYEVMRAIHDSGISISFKGSMVLRAFLIEAGYFEETRHTVDIDANWNFDNPPSAQQMIQLLQDALQKGNINLDVSIYRMYNEKRSAGFELMERTTGEVLFSMDIDINRPIPPTKIYEIAGLRFRGVSPTQMIADKIGAISTDKVFRRIKDVVDLYYLSKVFEFNRNEILQTMKNSGRSLDTFHAFLHRKDELKHSYEKFRLSGNVYKPPFDVIYDTVKSYIKDVLPKESTEI